MKNQKTYSELQEMNFGKPSQKQINEYFSLFGKSIPLGYNANQAGNVIGAERKRIVDENRNCFAEWCGKNIEEIQKILKPIVASKKVVEDFTDIVEKKLL